MRKVAELGGVLAIAYGAILALIFAFQSRLVYFPQMAREIVATPRAVGLAYEDVTLATSDGETLHGWWTQLPNARGAVLIFHGNAGNISHRLEYLTMFERLGYASLIFDYRGYGKSTGTPSEEGTYRDAEAAWQYLMQVRRLGAADIVLFGESLGGGVATWLAQREAPRAIVLGSTFTSVPDLGAEVYPWLPVRWLARIQYGNLARMRGITRPVLIAHSPQDDIIPFAHGQALLAAANEPKRFVELRGGHNESFILAREKFERELGAFLDFTARADRAAK
jgi:fermentation-respiration switch protein FrsA (DUF1100 family)